MSKYFSSSLVPLRKHFYSLVSDGALLKKVQGKACPWGPDLSQGCDTADAAERETDHLKDHEICVMFHKLSACSST